MKKAIVIIVRTTDSLEIAYNPNVEGNRFYRGKLRQLYNEINAYYIFELNNGNYEFTSQISSKICTCYQKVIGYMCFRIFQLIGCNYKFYSYFEYGQPSKNYSQCDLHLIYRARSFLTWLWFVCNIKSFLLLNTWPSIVRRELNN